MFDSSVLDVAAGVAFVFILVSTVCSAIREAIEHFLKTCASYLEYAIRELLHDRDGTQLASLRASVMAIQNSYVQRVMLIALDSSQGSLEEARKDREEWYDGAMDRASGWYKRSTQLILFAVALVVVVLANVDAVEIASRLYSDPALRAVAVSAAEKAQESDASTALQSLNSLQLPVGWHWAWPDGGWQSG